MCDFDELSDSDNMLTPPEVKQAAMEVSSNLLPLKSKKVYEKCYEKFIAESFVLILDIPLSS